MKKKVLKQMLKAKKQQYGYFYVTFTDGGTVEVPVDVTDGDMRAHDAFVNQLRAKNGTLPTAQGKVYQMRDVIRYEYSATKR